jgi:hypothetical protein
MLGVKHFFFVETRKNWSYQISSNLEGLQCFVQKNAQVGNMTHTTYTLMFMILNKNTKLAIYALDQVHCWGAYFCPGIGHYENFTLGGQENHVQGALLIGSGVVRE